MKLICTRGAAREYRDSATGREYFSFSQVAQVLDPQAYASVPSAIMADARTRGSRLHLLFGLLLASLTGACEAPEFPQEWNGYWEAMLHWIVDHKVKPCLIEESSTHPSLEYAGTPDALVLAGPKQVRTLVDLKTGSVRSRMHAVQVQAYSKLIGYEDCAARVVLYVSPDGTYSERKVENSAADWAWFQCGLGVLRGREQGGE